jgi:ribosome assembly protein YihI (activator of Der GTPase)
MIKTWLKTWQQRCEDYEGIVTNQMILDRMQEEIEELRKAPAQQGKASLRLAAEQALEALESLDCGDTYKTHNAASALRQALAHEALDRMVAENERLGLYEDNPVKRDNLSWVGLTEDEFENILERHNEATPFAVYLSIEAKLKEKNSG